jgi:hypothetical protein
VERADEVPEVIVKNLGHYCSAPALAEGVQALAVKSRNIDTVYAIPCQAEGRGVTGNLVYVLTTKGSFKYLSFQRLQNSSNYIPTPVLEKNGEEVTIHFSSPTSACRKAENGSYRLADNSNFLAYSFAAESISHTCEN